MPDINDQIREHTPLALFTIRKYFPTLYGDEDILQIAMIALWKAIATYNPDKGVAFTTYAIHCIRGRIQVTVRDQHAQKRTGTNVYFEDKVPGTERLTYKDTLSTMKDVSFIDTEGIKKALTPEDVETIRMLITCKNQGEIAQRIGVSHGTISRRVNRVRKVLTDHCV